MFSAEGAKHVQYPIVAFTSSIKLLVGYYNVLCEGISCLRAKIFSVVLKSLKRGHRKTDAIGNFKKIRLPI